MLDDKDTADSTEERVLKAIAWFITCLILFGVPFGIGLVVGHLCW